LLAIKKLEILEVEVTGLDEPETKNVYRVDYIPDELTYLTNLVEITLISHKTGLIISELLVEAR